MQPQQALDQYFNSVRTRDIEGLVALYAPDAVFTLPNGKKFEGAAAIRDMHASVFAAGAPFPTPAAIITTTDTAAAEIEARLPNGSVRRTVNFYHFNADGRIQRLNVYMQGG